MSSTRDIREGMQVYGSDDQLIGTVDWVDEDGLQVNGQRIPPSAVRRSTQNRVYLRGASVEYLATAGTERGLGTEQAAGEIRVPVVEERLEVEKRAGQIGEVEIGRAHV